MRTLVAPILFLLAAAPLSAAEPPAGSAAPTAEPGRRGYAVVVSRETLGRPGWKKVVDALRDRHDATVLEHGGDPADALPALRRLFPRHACFVERPEEATRELVAKVHRIVRKLDDDPFADTIWGILTGHDAENALAIASANEPLVVRKVLAATEVALELCEEGVWYCELEKGKSVRKAPGGRPTLERCEPDTTKALVDALNGPGADLFVTSGHATERDWQIGYRYRNGQFVSKDGELWGVDISGGRHRVLTTRPRVYLPIGNCLMGHIDGEDAMALAFLKSAGVRQMIGYTVPTWYGYAGWGCLDYFVEQPGRYTFAEAFHANLIALVDRLDRCFPELSREEPAPGQAVRAEAPLSESARSEGLGPMDGTGLLHDRDVVAFYGDPAWEARLADVPNAWEQRLSVAGDVWTFEIRPRLGESTFETVNRNGSQRGGRPIIELLPTRVEGVQILEGAELKPRIADDFVLVPRPASCEPGRVYRVAFRARPVASAGFAPSGAKPAEDT